MKAIYYFAFQDGAQGDAVLLGQQDAFASYCQGHGHQPILTLVEYDPEGHGRPRYQEMVEFQMP